MPELTDEVDYYKFEISKLPDGTPSHNLVTQDLEFASVGNLGIDTRQLLLWSQVSISLKMKVALNL